MADPTLPRQECTGDALCLADPHTEGCYATDPNAVRLVLEFHAQRIGMQVVPAGGGDGDGE